MKTSVLSAVAMVALAAGSAIASPTINSAVLNTRLYNDNPASNLVTTNSYPALVQFAETNLVEGFANRHNFRLSSNGSSAANFANADDFAIFADVTLSGPGNGEGGLSVSPWYSQNFEGTFNLRTGDGAIEVFGGRLPFYSFTAAQGLTYVKGTTVRVGIEYQPNGLSSVSPGQIRYTYGAASSGWLNFDEGNPSEGPVYGNWGTLKDAQVGGYTQILGSANSGLTASFANISYVPAPGVAGLLGLGGLVALRRRR